MGVAADTVDRNRALQTEWYGEPLGDRIRRVLARIGLSQYGLAGVLGLSAPMLSQLMSAQRAKISNPTVLHRLIAVEELAADPAFAAMPAAEVEERLKEIKAETAATTSGLRVAPAGAGAAERPDRAGRGAAQPNAQPNVQPTVRLLQVLLREVASAAEIDEAASLLGDRFPDLAELLRVFGNGRTSEVEARYARILREATGH